MVVLASFDPPGSVVVVISRVVAVLVVKTGVVSVVVELICGVVVVGGEQVWK